MPSNASACCCMFLMSMQCLWASPCGLQLSSSASPSPLPFDWNATRVVIAAYTVYYTMGLPSLHHGAAIPAASSATVTSGFQLARRVHDHHHRRIRRSNVAPRMMQHAHDVLALDAPTAGAMFKDWEAPGGAPPPPPVAGVGPPVAGMWLSNRHARNLSDFCCNLN